MLFRAILIKIAEKDKHYVSHILGANHKAGKVLFSRVNGVIESSIGFVYVQFHCLIK